MLDPVWDPDGKAREALRRVVTDFGARALSSPSILDNVLHDLLPDSPRQVSLILATGGSNVAALLQEHVSAGMDPDTAVRLAATQLAEQTAYDAAGCRWVTAEFARALGYQVSDEADPAPAAPAVPTVAPASPAPAAPVMPEVPTPVAVAPDQAVTMPPPGAAADAGPAASVPQRPKGRGRRVAAALVVLVVVVGGLLGGTAATGTWPFTSRPADLRLLLPSGTSGCTTNVTPFAKHLSGMTGVYACEVHAIKGEVFAYQFDNSADYLSAVNKLNAVSGFDPGQAGDSCPPHNKVVEGRTIWYTTSKSLFPKTAGQVLECYEVELNSSSTLRPSYVWTIPTENAFMNAIAGSTVSLKQLDTWWGINGGPNSR